MVLFARVKGVRQIGGEIVTNSFKAPCRSIPLTRTCSQIHTFAYFIGLIRVMFMYNMSREDDKKASTYLLSDFDPRPHLLNFYQYLSTMTDYIVTLLIEEGINPLMSTQYGRLTAVCAFTIVAVWLFHFRIIKAMPSVETKPYDIYSRLLLAWMSRCHPKASNYHANIHQEPTTRELARYFSIKNDPVESDDDELFFTTSELTCFFESWWIYFVVPAEDGNPAIHSPGLSNKHIKRLLDDKLNKGYIQGGKLRELVPRKGEWHELARPHRRADTYHHEDLETIIKNTELLFTEEVKFADQGKKMETCLPPSRIVRNRKDSSS